MEEYEDNYYTKIFNQLPSNIQEMILRDNNNILLDYIASGIEFDSPIEMIMVSYLNQLDIKSNFGFIIEPQYPIETEERTYYADIFITPMPYNEEFEDFNLVVECDGYEFHHKTKQQVDYDNEREYKIMLEGFDVLRFSGSEIYKEPKKAALKVFHYIVSKYLIKE